MLYFSAAGKIRSAAVLVQQTPRIGDNRRVKFAGFDIGRIGRWVIGGRADKPDDPFVLKSPQRPQRAIIAHHIFHRHTHRIVDIDEIELFQSKPFKTRLDAA